MYYIFIFIALLFFVIMIVFILSYLKKNNHLKSSQINRTIINFYNNKSYNEILPNLYIGNKDSAQDLSFIKNKHIQVIINCTNSVPSYYENNSLIKYYRLPVDDSLLFDDIQKMTYLLPKYVNIIDKALEFKQPVLVHCYAGRQRSATLIAAYLIFKFKYSLEYAYHFIISKRKEAFHYGKSFNFNISLLEYQKNNLNSV